MQIKYKKCGDYLLPNLTLNNKNNDNIGKYGLIVLNHLKANKKALYQTLLMQDKLTDYLIDIDNDITIKVNNLVKELAEKENIDESLKEKDQLKWVGLMNNIKITAEEILLKELIQI